MQDWGNRKDVFRQGDLDEDDDIEEVEIQEPNKSGIEQDQPLFEDEVLEDLEFDPEELEDESDINMDEIMKKVQEMTAGKKPPPPPRSGGCIEITFTDRGLLPTKVARESEDAKWHARIKEAKEAAVAANNQIVAPNDQEEEEINGELSTNQVQLLLDKAKQFVAVENFEAAVNAYTSVLQVEASNITALMNRSMCYVKLEKFADCIEDCDKALYIHDAEEAAICKGVEMGEGVDHGMEMRKRRRCKILVRRGSALAFSNQLAKGICDFEVALQLVPSEELRQDLERMKAGVAA